MRINYKFVSRLTIAFLLTIAIVMGVHSLQVDRLDMSLLEKARAAARTDDHVSATRYYSNYLDSKADSIDVRFEYAKVLHAAGDASQAIQQLRRVLRQDPERLEAQSLLAALLRAAGKYAAAKSHLENFLVPADPQNSEWLWMLGCCEHELSEFDNARTHLEAATKRNPRDPQFAWDLANLLTVRFGDIQAAEACLDRAVEAAPRDPQAYLARGRWQLERCNADSAMDQQIRTKFLDAAWSDATNALELAPNDISAIELAVQLAIESNQFDRVDELLVRCLKTNPVSPKLYGAAAAIALQRENARQAIAHLEHGLRANPGDPDLVWNLAQLHLDHRDFEAFDELYGELTNVEYPSAPLRYLQAKKLHLEGDFRGAVTILEESRSLFVDNGDLVRQTDFLLAECYGAVGKHDQQLECLRRVVNASPLWTAARRSLAATLLKKGHFQESLQEYRQLARQPNPKTESLITFARLLFLNAVNRNPQAPEWSELNLVLATLSRQVAAQDDVAILRAEQSAASGDYDQAEQILRQQIQQIPDSLPLRQALVRLAVFQESWDQAIEVLDAAETDFGDSSALRIEHARLLIRRDGPSVALETLDRLARPNSDWALPEKLSLAVGMARYFLSLDEHDRCERCARIFAQSSKGQSDLSIHLLMFDLAFRSRNIDSMAESLARVREIEGDGPLWRVGEAIRLSAVALQSEGNKAEMASKAIEHLNEAETARPTWSRIPRLQAEIFDSLGQSDLAIERYLKAVRLGEQSPRLVSRTMFLLFERGRFIEAENLFRKLDNQQIPFSSELMRVASEISLKLEDFDRALSLAKDWAEHSKRPQDRVWLAQMYSLTGDDEAAERTFREAIRLSPSSPTPWVSLVQMYGRNGKPELAVQTIEESRSKIDPDSRDFAIAQSYESIGQLEQAGEYYEKSLSSKPNDSRVLRQYGEFLLKQKSPLRSLAVLEKLAGDRFNHESVDQAWARRNLALLLGLQGTRAGFERACELIAQNRESIGVATADQKVLGIVHGASPNRDCQTTAIRILRSLVADPSEYSMDDQFLLASLYRKRGDWTNYSRQMRSLLGQGGADHLRFVADYARALLDHGETDEAELWCGRLVKISPGGNETATLLARLDFETGQTRTLLSRLDQLARGEKRLAAELAESFAAGYDKISDHKQAEALIQKSESWFAEVSSDDPSHAEALAAHYARQGKLSTSLRLIAKTPLTENQLVRLGRDAMKGGSISDAELMPLIDRIRHCKEFSSSVPLKMCLADLLGWTQQWAEAAVAYEEVLKLRQDHVPALNNLAMVYALSGENTDRARKAIETAIDLVGQSSHLLDTRGMVSLATGDAEAAEMDFRLALDADAGNHSRADRHFHLAWALLSLKRLDEAEAMFDQARSRGLEKEMIHPLERPVFDRMSRLF